MVSPSSIGDVRDDIEHSVVTVEMAETLITSAADESSSFPTGEYPFLLSDEEIAPLLNQSRRSKINIFALPYSRRKSAKDQITRLSETETSPFQQFTVWTWNGSRYSGLLCVTVLSIIYCLMEVVSDVFTAQSIPLFEMAFTRSTVILVLSFLWLKRSRQPIFGTSSVRKLLVLRALIVGFCLLALILSFATPIMAVVAARVILHEKLKIAEIGGLACSFFGCAVYFSAHSQHTRYRSELTELLL